MSKKSKNAKKIEAVQEVGAGVVSVPEAATETPVDAHPIPMLPPTTKRGLALHDLIPGQVVVYSDPTDNSGAGEVAQGLIVNNNPQFLTNKLTKYRPEFSAKQQSRIDAYPLTVFSLETQQIHVVAADSVSAILGELKPLTDNQQALAMRDVSATGNYIIVPTLRKK